MSQINVRAYLAPVPVLATKGSLTLDALLYAAMYLKTGHYDPEAWRDLPLEKVTFSLPEGDSEECFYRCTGIQPDPKTVQPELATYRRRFKSERMASFSTISVQMNMSSGTYKAWDITRAGFKAKYAEWAAEGDIATVESLLKHLTNIGGCAGKGYGQVLRWELTPLDGDGHLPLWDEDGIPLRPIPVAAGITPPVQREVMGVPHRTPGYACPLLPCYM